MLITGVRLVILVWLWIVWWVFDSDFGECCFGGLCWFGLF